MHYEGFQRLVAEVPGDKTCYEAAGMLKRTSSVGGGGGGGGGGMLNRCTPVHSESTTNAENGNEGLLFL